MKKELEYMYSALTNSCFWEERKEVAKANKEVTRCLWESSKINGTQESKLELDDRIGAYVYESELQGFLRGFSLACKIVGEGKNYIL